MHHMMMHHAYIPIYLGVEVIKPFYMMLDAIDTCILNGVS